MVARPRPVKWLRAALLVPGACIGSVASLSKRSRWPVERALADGILSCAAALGTSDGQQEPWRAKADGQANWLVPIALDW
jgi:hypothetical protein